MEPIIGQTTADFQRLIELQSHGCEKPKRTKNRGLQKI